MGIDIKDMTAQKLQNANERKIALFLSQKQTLDTFLSHGAITEAQYAKSLHDLRDKMGVDGENR